MAEETILGGFIINQADIPDGECKCPKCGKIIERGIISLSRHWSECTGKDFTKGLMGHYDEHKSLTVQDVEDLHKKHLK